MKYLFLLLTACATKEVERVVEKCPEPIDEVDPCFITDKSGVPLNKDCLNNGTKPTQEDYDVKLKVLEIVKSSSCKSFNFRDVDGNRDTVPLQFLIGVAQSYYQSKCNNLKDFQNLETEYAGLISLASFETTWNVCEGKDPGASNTNGNNTEAGAWQTSWDATNEVPSLKEFFLGWQGDCMKAEFGNKNCDHSKTWGPKDAISAKFQYSSKNCPAMAAEFALINIRAQGQVHYWPIKKGLVETAQSCVDMMNKIKAIPCQIK